MRKKNSYVLRRELNPDLWITRWTLSLCASRPRKHLILFLNCVHKFFGIRENSYAPGLETCIVVVDIVIVVVAIAGSRLGTSVWPSP